MVESHVEMALLDYTLGWHVLMPDLDCTSGLHFEDDLDLLLECAGFG